MPVDINGSWHYSILFEWVSPINKIVLNYGDEPDWYLVGVVNHDHYSVWSQSRLNEMANEFNLKRPPTYTFSGVEDLLKDVDQWRGKEGVVVYSKKNPDVKYLQFFPHRSYDPQYFLNGVPLTEQEIIIMKTFIPEKDWGQFKEPVITLKMTSIKSIKFRKLGLSVLV